MELSSASVSQEMVFSGRNDKISSIYQSWKECDNINYYQCLTLEENLCSIDSPLLQHVGCFIHFGDYVFLVYITQFIPTVQILSSSDYVVN